MATNEETIYQGQVNEQKKGVNETAQKKGNSDWQKVTISGVTGIIIGAAGATAVSASAASPHEYIESTNDAENVKVEEVTPMEDAKNKTEVTPVKNEDDNVSTENVEVHIYHHVDIGEATAETGPIEVQFGKKEMMVAHVDDEMSFGDAFAAARAQVGAGGAFHWHGNTYSTYYEEEWNSMSDTQKADYAHRVAPEVGHLEQIEDVPAPTDDIVENPTDHIDVNVTISVSQSDDIQQIEPDVHFLGMDRIEYEDGSGAATMGKMEVEETNVALLDVDGDHVFDIAIADANGNGDIDEEEVVDISNYHSTVEQFADALISGSDIVTTEQEGTNMYTQEGMDGDMPDYVDDADLQSV